MKNIPPITPMVDISHIDISLFIIEDQYFGNIYPFKTENEVLLSLLREMVYYDLPKYVFDLFVEAWNSRFWVNYGYDGATVIKNKKHTAVGNFIHDYQYRCGMGGIEADVIYRHLLTMTGYYTSLSYKRYFIIRVAWLSFFKPKHWLTGNVTPLTDNIIDCYDKIKK